MCFSHLLTTLFLFCKVRFLADLTNCRVLMPSALLEFFNLFVAATMESDVPQVPDHNFVGLKNIHTVFQYSAVF